MFYFSCILFRIACNPPPKNHTKYLQKLDLVCLIVYTLFMEFWGLANKTIIGVALEKHVGTYEEKRKFERVSIDAEAECEVFSVDCQALALNRQNSKIYVKVDNISLGGLHIITEAQIPVEQILRMKVKFKENGYIVWIYSQVRWFSFDDTLKKYRVGLQFFYLQEKYRETFNKIIESRLN